MDGKDLPNRQGLLQALPVREVKLAMETIVNDIIAEPINHKEELELILNETQDPIIELARAGVVIGAKRKTRSVKLENDRLESEKRGSEKHKIEAGDDFYDKIINQIRAPAKSSVSTLSSLKTPKGIVPILARSEFKPVTAEADYARAKEPLVGFVVEERIVDFYQKPITPTSLQARPVQVLPVKKSFNFAFPIKKNFSKKFFVILGIAGILSYGLTLKHELTQDGALALTNLEKAQEDFKSFNFLAAAESFQKSYQDFSQAGRNLNLFGAGLASLVADLPGLNDITAGGAGKLKSAKDLTEIGKLISASGQAMAEALSALSKTGAILNPQDDNKTKPSKIINQIQDALALSTRNFNKAKALLLDIDEAVIPEDKMENFKDFKDKVPLFEQTLSDASDYTNFLEGVIGIDKPRKYLLLFNNNSELRPTGGFPGTYGVVSFSSGGLADFFVDDVYNLDGQLKKNIIPPKQLQHITPTLGMRDSSWFIDFPTSARNAMWFFNQESGYKVDGVIAVTPEVVSEILKVIGPIKMSEYDMNLTADNFLENIQEEVEYGENRAQPKKVVVDFAPKFLEKLYSADSEKWMKIFNVLVGSLEEKDLLFYFDEKALETFTIDKGFGGEIQNLAGDYLTVNFSNVKGSKTDAVTDNSIELDSRIESGKVFHKVTIIRDHNGGDEEHGFYNRQNPAYVRVLLPKNAEVISVSGNDPAVFKPLINYGLGGFSENSDLKRLESSFYVDKSLGVDRYEESGKQGIGFWMITDPGKTRKVEFEYSVPISRSEAPRNEYSFYFQKQPGLDWKDFKFVLNSAGISAGETPQLLNRIGDKLIYQDNLSKDFQIDLKLK